MYRDNLFLREYVFLFQYVEALKQQLGDIKRSTR